VIGKTPHSNIGTQYGPTANLGIGFIEAHGDRFTFRMYDTADNVAAVETAIELARGDIEAPAQTLVDETVIKAELKAEELKGIVLPAANRAKARDARRTRQLDAKSATARKMQAEMMDDLRGVRRVI
jgi:polyhydroxyalkanoate synthesis regulator phasin